MFINNSRDDYYSSFNKLTNPIVSHIKNKSNSNFDNTDDKHSGKNLYQREKEDLNSRTSSKDKILELNQILYMPSIINTMILKSKFETMA